jgi:hypothetical protein
MTIPGPSKSEQILTAVEALLAGTHGITTDNNGNKRIYRGRSEAVARGEVPAITIDAVAELANSGVTNCNVVCTLAIHIRIHVQGDAASRAADPIRCSVHSLLFSQPRLGGLTHRLRRSERRPAVEWDDEQGDNMPGFVDLFYEYEFTTLAEDLTQ